MTTAAATYCGMELAEFFEENNMFSTNNNNGIAMEEDMSDSSFYSPVALANTGAGNNNASRHRRPSITFAAIAPDFAAFDEYWLAYADSSSNNSPHPQAVISRSNSPSAFNPARRLSLSVLFASPSPTLSLEEYNNYLASSVPNADNSFSINPQSISNSGEHQQTPQKQADTNSEEGLQLDLVGYANTGNGSYANYATPQYHTSSVPGGIPSPYYYQQPVVLQEQLHMFSPKGNSTVNPYAASSGSGSYSTPALFSSILPAVATSMSPTGMGLHPLESAAYFANIKSSASPIATPIPTTPSKLWGEPSQLLPSALSSPNASIQPRNQKQIGSVGIQNIVAFPPSHQLPPGVGSSPTSSSGLNLKPTIMAHPGKLPSASPGTKFNNSYNAAKKGASIPSTSHSNSNKKKQTTSGIKQKSNSSNGSGGMSASERKKILELRRTKTSRLKWTPELQDIFVATIERLGVNAVPSTILDVMNVEGLTRENVASHLQKYRQHCARGTTGRSHKKFLHSQQIAPKTSSSSLSSSGSSSITAATVKPPLSSSSASPSKEGFRPFVPTSSNSVAISTPTTGTTASTNGVGSSSLPEHVISSSSLETQQQQQITPPSPQRSVLTSQDQFNPLSLSMLNTDASNTMAPTLTSSASPSSTTMTVGHPEDVLLL